MNEQPRIEPTQEIATPKIKDRKPLKVTGLVVLALITLTAIGYSMYAWQQNQTLTSSVNTKNAKIAALDKEVSSSNLTSTTATNENIIPIKELGISITVPDSLKDLTYSYGYNNGVGSVSLSTQTLTDEYPGCAASSVAPPLGSFSKISGQHDLNDPYNILAKQFSDYFIGWSASQAPCGNTQVSTLDSLLDGLHDSFTTIKEL